MNNGMIECSVCHSRLVSPGTKTVSRAYDRHRSKISSKHRALNVFLVVGDCILVGLQVIFFQVLLDSLIKFLDKRKFRKTLIGTTYIICILVSPLVSFKLWSLKLMARSQVVIYQVEFYL